MFLKNAWYVAAWDHEVSRELKPVTILGEKIVLYRRQNGQAAALEALTGIRRAGADIVLTYWATDVAGWLR